MDVSHSSSPLSRTHTTCRELNLVDVVQEQRQLLLAPPFAVYARKPPTRRPWRNLVDVVQEQGRLLLTPPTRRPPTRRPCKKLLVSYIHTHMAFRVVRAGASAALQVDLRRGDSVKAEPDALVTMSQHVTLGAALDAGLLSGLLRAIFGGESVFVQTVQAHDDGDATFAPSEVGDIELIEVRHGSDVLLQKGSFLASHQTVDLQSATQLSASKALLSGAGLFVLRASGQGTLAVNAMGGILRFDLRRGESRAVDNGHLVAWDAGLEYDVRMAAQRSGFLSSGVASAASGEGLMCFFRGPGRVWLQTHKPQVEEAGQVPSGIQPAPRP